MSAEKVHGLYNIQGWLLRGSTEEFSEWFSHCIKLSPWDGIVPHQWLKGRLIFIPKDYSMEPTKFWRIIILIGLRLFHEKVLFRRLSSELSTNISHKGFKRGTDAISGQQSLTISPVAREVQPKSSWWLPSTAEWLSTASAF